MFMARNLYGPYYPCYLHWHRGNRTIALVPGQWPWKPSLPVTNHSKVNQKTNSAHNSWAISHICYGPFLRYVKLRVVHAPGMPGTFSPPLQVSDPDMHHATCVAHVPWCIPGSLTSCFLWSWWRVKRSRHSRHMRNPQFYVSGKRPIELDHHRITQGLVAYLVSELFSGQYKTVAWRS